MKIDAHQHFWRYERTKHDWIDDSMQSIQKDFLPADLKQLLDKYNFDGCITVQVEQHEEETINLLELAGQNSFIKGVVGWADLQLEDADRRIQSYRQFTKLKGFRHVIQSEPDPDFLARPAFRNGIKQLQRYDYAYDILIYPHQLKATINFVKAFPNQRFVLDHLAKPNIKKGLFDVWKKDITLLAEHENVWCKISGLVTEADWANIKQTDFVPYIETAVEAFGTNRIMFGSDWPVCTVAAAYDDVIAIVDQVFKPFSEDERNKFYGLNAAEFYKLS